MKKMYLIPPDMVDNYQRKQRISNIENPERKVKEDVDDQMNDILHNSSLSDRDKVVLYSQLLPQLMKQRTPTQQSTTPKTVEHRPQPPQEPQQPQVPQEPQAVPQVQQEDPWVNMSIKNVPAKYRRTADSLFSYLKLGNRVQWNPDGSLKIDDHDYPESNIMDIVGYTTRQRKHLQKPPGTDALMEYLKDSNAPREVIGNTSLWKPQGIIVDTPPKTPSRPKIDAHKPQWRLHQH